MSDLDLEGLSKAESITKGAAQIILNEWSDAQATKKIILLKELEIKEKNLEKNFSFKKQCLYSGVILAIIAAAIGAYGVHIRAEATLLGTALAFISGIAGVFLWGYQRKE